MEAFSPDRPSSGRTPAAFSPTRRSATSSASSSPGTGSPRGRTARSGPKRRSIPEMLGKTFESLMAAPDRKTTGAFYTPQSLVEQLTTSALVSAMSAKGVPAESIIGALAGELPSVDHRRRILDVSERLCVLDPACGSGAFLVHFLERLASLRIHLGESRPIHVVRREILTRSIFGVDVNPTAVWLCELRLWLSMAIENPERNPAKVAPLPNLDRNIRIGDSLAGGSFAVSNGAPQPARITSLRARYSRTVGRRKKVLARMLDQLERDCAVGALDRSVIRLTNERRELLGAVRSPDLFGERRVAAAVQASSCRSCGNPPAPRSRRGAHFYAAVRFPSHSTHSSRTSVPAEASISSSEIHHG